MIFGKSRGRGNGILHFSEALGNHLGKLCIVSRWMVKEFFKVSLARNGIEYTIVGWIDGTIRSRMVLFEIACRRMRRMRR